MSELLQPTLPQSALSRRTLLKRGALVGAATAWTVPVVQAFSMTSASAASPSGTLPTTPAVPPPGNATSTPVSPTSGSSGIDSTSIHRDPSSGSSTSGSTSGSSSGIDASVTSKPASTTSSSGVDAQTLSQTGLPVPLMEALTVGAGAVVIGLGAVAAGRRPKPGPRQH